jgi:pimeloyl-ACP methyl ester carboxylesterase
MKAKKSKFSRRVFVFLFASLVLLPGYQAFASAADMRVYPPPGQMIYVGGHHLHLHCMGEGEPVVVMEAGMSGWSADWVLTQPEVAKTTRVCAYDRAGYGWSEEGPLPRDSRQAAAELHTLLSKASIEGKVILVGHSLGGLFAQYFAQTYPRQVAGIILVDSVHPEQSLRMKEDVRKTYEENLKSLTLFTSLVAPTGLFRLANQPETIIVAKLPDAHRPMAGAMGLQAKAYRALAGEMASFDKSQIQARNAGPLPAVPMTVLSSAIVRDFPPGFSGEYMKSLWDELQNDLANQQVDSLHVSAENSEHYIHLDQPDLVIDAIVVMVEQLRHP